MIRYAMAAALLALPQAAAAQANACLARHEVRTLFAFLAPTLVDSAAKKCVTVLPADAFLRTDAPAMVERLRTESEAQSSGFAAVLEKMSGKKIPEGLSEETMRSLMRDIIGTEFTKGIKPGDCGPINELVSALAPLPGANIGTIAAILLEAGGSKAKSPLKICEG